MKATFTLAILACSITAQAADFVLVGKDRQPAPIVVFEDAPPRTRDAAVTLADYIAKISGQKPEVIDGEPKAMPERGDLDRRAACGEILVFRKRTSISSIRRKRSSSRTKNTSSSPGGIGGIPRTWRPRAVWR